MVTLMRFRLLSGMYEDFDPKMQRPAVPQKQGESRKDWEERATREAEEWERKARRVFHFNDPAHNVIDTDIDLCRHYNSSDPNAAPKFERVFDVQDGRYHQMPDETVEQFIARIQAAETGKPGTPLPSSETLESMTVEDLRKMAEEEEVDLGNAKTKKEIIARLQGSMQPA